MLERDDGFRVAQELGRIAQHGLLGRRKGAAPALEHVEDGGYGSRRILVRPGLDSFVQQADKVLQPSARQRAQLRVVGAAAGQFGQRQAVGGGQAIELQHGQLAGQSLREIEGGQEGARRGAGGRMGERVQQVEVTDDLAHGRLLKEALPADTLERDAGL